MLVKHLLKVFKKKFQGDDNHGHETEKQRMLREQQEKNEISLAQYIDILFNMIITQAEFRAVESMGDFVDLVDQKFLRIMDIG